MILRGVKKLGVEGPDFNFSFAGTLGAHLNYLRYKQIDLGTAPIHGPSFSIFYIVSSDFL